MEKVISSLVQSFEKGKMTRRELVQTLAMLTLSGGTTAAQGLRVRKVDHASVCWSATWPGPSSSTRGSLVSPS